MGTSPAIYLAVYSITYVCRPSRYAETEMSQPTWQRASNRHSPPEVTGWGRYWALYVLDLQGSVGLELETP